MKKHPKFIAHRGLSGAFAENTHRAFNKAWQKNCDGIELDIQVSKDGKVIVMHDENTQRSCGENLEIKHTSWQDLKKLNPTRLQSPKAPVEFLQAKKTNENKFIEGAKIPLLSEVLKKMPSGKIIQIEVKHQIENIDAVVSELTKMRTDIIPLIISFDAKKLVYIKKALPKLKCLLIKDADFPPIKEPLEFVLEHKLDGLDLHYELIDANMVKKCRESKLLLGAWTVNSAKIAKQMFQLNIDFIASDFADEFLALK